jgi:hypothetical protein
MMENIAANTHNMQDLSALTRLSIILLDRGRNTSKSAKFFTPDMFIALKANIVYSQIRNIIDRIIIEYGDSFNPTEVKVTILFNTTPKIVTSSNIEEIIAKAKRTLMNPEYELANLKSIRKALDAQIASMEKGDPHALKKFMMVIEEKGQAVIEFKKAAKECIRNALIIDHSDIDSKALDVLHNKVSAAFEECMYDKGL